MLLVKSHILKNYVVFGLRLFSLLVKVPTRKVYMFLTPQPNKTKPPLQVLPVIEGNSEKIRFVGSNM
jgi:hypothetical protein